ncbi:MAG: methylated-DNA--[protein]-cysteine S-methyltransferase [Planctomycetaceae bacterium]|nr:MAG: methylated-DNA--[protein]-cysteine S-methyltransferase [Planctomycetaceae bacterium]
MIFPQNKVFATRLGWFAIAWSDRGLAALTFGHPDRETARMAIGGLATVRGTTADDHLGRVDLVVRLQAYSDGYRDDFRDVPLDLSDMTDFQRRVSLACRAIPWGETLTYGQLAARVGSPRAARAVGGVMSRNRLPIVIPCHRVLGTARRLGGYSAVGGLDMKRHLLILEGVARFSQPEEIRHG